MTIKRSPRPRDAIQLASSWWTLPRGPRRVAWMMGRTRRRRLWAVRAQPHGQLTPAMAAGVSATLWELADMVKMLEEWEAAS